MRSTSTPMTNRTFSESSRISTSALLTRTSLSTMYYSPNHPDHFGGVRDSTLLLHRAGSSTISCYPSHKRRSFLDTKLNSHNVGVALLLENCEVIAWTGDLRTVGLPYELQYGAYNLLGYQLNPLRPDSCSRNSCLGRLYLMLARTRLGRSMRACSQGREAAQLVEINFPIAIKVLFHHR